MTAEVNTKWKHYELVAAIEAIQRQIKVYKSNVYHGIESPKTTLEIKALEHSIAFIEYNMKEMEINGGNGDE